MAPRATSRARNHKSKGERKKKEDKLLPAVLDILVNLPSGEEVILKGISTDRVLDVRKLLAVNVETCHLTRFSLSHQARGDNLSDSQEVIHLKPCILTLVEEEYTKDEAIAHVRRLLDIIACTTSFGKIGEQQQELSTSINSKEKEHNPGTEAGLQDFADIARLCPPSKLGKFYEFFSFSHLKPPIQAVRKLSLESGSNDFFSLEVKVSNGKLFTVASSSGGFHHAGKQCVRSHTLVDLLRHLSKAFDDAYDELLKGFSERNKFANLPYNLRANTWLVPPVAAESPASFPPLPAEDEAWGGNGGGRGRDPGCLERPWARLFDLVSKLPCGTQEEREARDHKAFILHNYFVDVATTHAVEVIRELDSRSPSLFLPGDEHVEKRGSLRFTVTLDSIDPCEKAHWKIESCSSGSREGSVSERNLLKGITADESTVVHDVRSLGIVLVRHQGYKAAVEALMTENEVQSFDIPEPAEGGANALNANSLRTLLHGKPAKASDEESVAREVVQKLLNDGIEKMSSQQEAADTQQFIRWELGACWIQHLGEKKKDKNSSKESKENEPSPLKDVLSEACLKRLRETGSGLHLKFVPELLSDAQKFYDDVALPKLVADFAALELSPVEGRTLTDFMHIRGLRIYSLGHLAELCANLPHIRLLCIHEMVIRALKHFIRAVVASVKDVFELAQTLATALNLIFGGAREPQASLENPLQKWLVLFVKERYGWKLAPNFWLQLRTYAVLRGVCYKVGIEMVSRDYDFESSTPFTKADLISMVPVYKHAICSSADGRTLLESSKTALDKGKLEDAVSYGSKALAKLIAVCGAYHRMTAGAYSLLAVVLYHTGDFVQAMTYQQKALDINERELGLDHPDTMKSYGDLAVFYYRLQHTELALRYVNRALYLLHLICGPSHPNTAATYINVAMMEEALGNPHVALRYLHQALKCNERLLGKDHIQTAASYHAIAIALSLMEAYSLSVHHEQTTFQILQAKLGPDDIRTQDAAAWLEYFDSKAVEQQEAARTGAPKPDPNVASKGHLSVSDLLEYINAAEVAETNDKGLKKVKRLKILSREEEVSNAIDALRRASPALDGGKPAAGGVSERVTPKHQPVEMNSSGHQQQQQQLLERQQEFHLKTAEKPGSQSKTGSDDDRFLVPNSPASVADGVAPEAEDGGWLEASSRGKTHRRLHHRLHHPANRRAPALNATTTTTTSRGNTSSKQEKEEAPKVEAPPVPVKTPVAPAAALPPQGDQARSYRDVALLSRSISSNSAQALRRPPPTSPQVQQVSQAPAAAAAADKTKPESTGTHRSDAEDDSVSQASSASQAGGAAASPRGGGGAGGAGTQPTVAAVTPLKPSSASGSGKQQPQEAPPPSPATAVALATTVAVTPIRKQVQLPSKTSNAAQGRAPSPAARSPPASPAAALAATAPASSAAAAAAAPNAGVSPVAGSGKKPMNPFAIEFVPGRKWHPLSPTSETNSLQTTGGTGFGGGEIQEEKEEEALKPEPPVVGDVEDDEQQEKNDPGEAPPAVAHELDAGETPAPEDHLEVMIEKPAAAAAADDQPVEKTIHTSDYYSSDSNWTEEKSDSSEGGALAAAETRAGYRPVMRRSTGSKSRSKSRWQRRSDGAITRVYRIQGDKSSVNPQLRTTSTFSDVPEPHTIQPGSTIMRRSVRVS